MQRQLIQDYIAENYAIFPQYLWQKHPSFAVYRHQDKKSKWFALVADVANHKLGLPDNHISTIVNVKCRPEMIITLHHEGRILPAYHMNKEHWFTMILDDKFSHDELFFYIDWSFDLTKS